MRNRKSLAAAVLILGCASALPALANADPYEVRREMREGARNVEMERRESAREIERCRNHGCVVRERNEARREIDRERREARNEVHYARNDDYRRDASWYRNTRNDDNGRHYGSNYGPAYAHYHPNGQYCRDGRHIAHMRDAYYRGDRRWYRDNRYWNEDAYVNRYYRARDNRNHDDGNDDLMRGIVIGAAVVGVIAAVHEANDND